MTKLLVLFVLVACAKTDNAKPGTAADPWAAPAPAPPPPTPTAATPATTDDPWSAKAAPATADGDPWAPTPEPAEAQPAPHVPANAPPEPTQAGPTAPPQRRPSGGASTLAGSYQCQQLRYGIGPNGMRQSNYVSSALGVFEVAGDGTYRSASYPGKGTGRVRNNADSVTFEGGAYPGSVGLAGTTQSGSFYVRFSGNLTDAPPPNMQFNDHMCYRK